MKAKKIISLLEEWAPPALQEGYDNSGLMCGDPEMEVKGALLSLDCTEEVLDEAIKRGLNMLICHHPLIFGSLKSISGKNLVERCLIKAIKNDLLIYSIHTNLDNVKDGVNKKLAEVIGLQSVKILRPRKEELVKLSFFVPTKDLEKVRQAVFAAGAGEIGNYSQCSFNVVGKGTYHPNEGTNPHLGTIGELHEEEEFKVEVILPGMHQSKVVNELIRNHPYEEVAYDVYPLKNHWNEVGSGMIGELEEEIPVNEFLKGLKSKLNAAVIRHTVSVKNKVKRIAICGGSGSFLLADAIREGADVFVTADYKYHQFFEAEGKILIADVGHFESEQFTSDLIQEYLQEKIPNFATYLSESRTNPIHYL